MGFQVFRVLDARVLTSWVGRTTDMHLVADIGQISSVCFGVGLREIKSRGVRYHFVGSPASVKLSLKFLEGDIAVFKCNLPCFKPRFGVLDEAVAPRMDEDLRRQCRLENQHTAMAVMVSDSIKWQGSLCCLAMHSATQCRCYNHPRLHHSV